MTGTIALVANRHELTLMHKDCAYVASPSRFLYLADLTNPSRELEHDRCEWCALRLDAVADPHLEIRAGA